jgi:hypothetical protein
VGKVKNVKKLLSSLAILAGTAVIVTPFVSATPEMAKKEGVNCLTCHVAVGPAELNDTGKCYKKNSYSLKNCPLPRSK